MVDADQPHIVIAAQNSVDTERRRVVIEVGNGGPTRTDTSGSIYHSKTAIDWILASRRASKFD